MSSKYNNLKKRLTKKILDINFDGRFLSVYLMIAVIFLYLISGLFELQLVSGRKNLLAATRTSQSTELIIPPRGLIYDSNDQILAYNAPSYSLYIEKSLLQVDKEREVITKLAESFGREPNDLLDTYRSQAYSAGNTENDIKIITGIDSDSYFKGLGIVSSLKGVRLESENLRTYRDAPYFSNILGYIGKPNELDLVDGVYTISKVGKDGVEKVYDEYLRGKAGKEVLQKKYLEGTETTFIQEVAKSGDNVHLTIDGQWQKKLSEIMQERLEVLGAFASAGVVMDSNTGEIKAMVSLPNYDNNLFVDAIKNEQYTSLLSDPRSPLINRPIALQLPSGSIYKIVGASAALEERVITSGTVINSEGCMKLSAGVEFCEADKKVLGDLTVVSALSKSSNLFFCKVAMRMNSQADGIDTILTYARDYGLGQKTGVDLLGEQIGSLPSPELKKKLFNENWYVGDDCNSIIGQGLLTVTPLQMTVAVSAVNNGGNILKPQVLSKIVDQEGNVVKEMTPETVRKVAVSETNLETIKQGMRSAAEEGSASLLKGLPGDIIMKTGSADAAELINGKLYEGAHSWVTGCFNDNGNDYCFVFMQQWGGRGFQTVPIVKKFVNCVQQDFASKCQDIN